MFKELNSKVTIKAGIDLTKLPFVKLSECVGESLVLRGFFFTVGDYGSQVVVVTDDKKINMPRRSIEQFEKIRDNDEMLKSLLEGHCLLTNIEERKTKVGKTTIYTLEDC